MQSMWMVFAAALAGALVLTPLARALARRLRIVDQPDGKRKLQKRPVPLFGGVAVYLSLLFGITAVQFVAPDMGGALDELSNVLIAAAGFVCLFGCIDDTWDLSARFKLLLQACSVLPIVLGGYSIDRILAFGYPIELGWLGVPITVLWLLGCINALNLLDGMDGLASVVGLSTAAMLAIIAANLGHGHVSLIAMALAGALAGFLVYNLPPASIYLGDSGSMVIGLVVGILGMQATLKTPATLSITAPAVLMSIPMLDTVMAIVRRKLSGQRFYAPDRGHIHHRLLERGLNNWQALGIIGLLTLMTGGSAAAAIVLRSDGLAWATAISVVVLLVRLRVFGHYEVALLKLTIAAGLVRMVHGLLMSARSRHRPLLGQNAPIAFEDAWATLIAEAKKWSVHSLEISVGQGELCQARHEWRTGAAPLDEGYEWSFGLSFRGADARYCHLRVVGQDARSADPWYLPRASRILKTFGEYWAAWPDRVPPPKLSVVGDDEAPAVLPSPSHALPPREAA